MNELNRRHFLLRAGAGLSAAWVSANWPALLSAARHAHNAAKAATPPKSEFFTPEEAAEVEAITDRKSTRLNSSHLVISYAVFCLKKKKKDKDKIHCAAATPRKQLHTNNSNS